MKIELNDIDLAKKIERMIFPVDEPWLANEESQAAARRGCVAAAMRAKSGSEAIVEQDVGSESSPLAAAIAARIDEWGLATAKWLLAGGSLENFERKRGEFEATASMLASGFSLKDTGGEGLSNRMPEWMARKAGWSSAMADGPLSSILDSKTLLWNELVSVPPSPCAPDQAAFCARLYESGRDPEKTEEFESAMRAYSLAGTLPSAGDGARQNWGRAAHKVREIVFPSEEGWGGNVQAGAFVDRACEIMAISAWWRRQGEPQRDFAEGFETAAMSVLRQEMPKGDQSVEDACGKALDRAWRDGRKVAEWLGAGGSLEKFKDMESVSKKEQAELFAQWVPVMVGGAPEEAARYGRARAWFVGASARARALADGPYAGESPSDVLWSEAKRNPCVFDAEDRKALFGELGSEGASSTSELLGAAMMVAQTPLKAAPGVVRWLGDVSDGVEKALNDALTGKKWWDARLKVAGAIDAPVETPGLIADRIKNRFGFASVLADGIGSGEEMSRVLMHAEDALSESALRLGVVDNELGRRGKSTLTLSASRLRARGAAGYCALNTGNISLGTPADVSTIVHEWAHSVDALAARACGFESGTLTDQAKWASKASSGGLGFKAVESLAEAIRGRGEDADGPAREREQERLGRLMAAKLAMEVLGRPRWACASESSREAFLKEASEPAFGIVASGALAIRQFEKDREAAPKSGVKEAEAASSTHFAERVEASVSLAAEGEGGYLGINARRLAGLMQSHFDADAETALAAAVRQLKDGALGLGRQALAAGEPSFVCGGVARLGSSGATAYDAAQKLQNGLYVERREADPRARSEKTLVTGYFTMPSEILARSVERFTATSAGELVDRAVRMMLSPTTRADAERFKKAWGDLLDSASIAKRPEGMRLAKQSKALDEMLAALGRPIRSLVLEVQSLSDKLSQRRALAKLSSAPIKAAERAP